MTSILFLAADPTDASRLRLGEEAREIREKLQLSKLRETIFLHERSSVRPEDFTQALLDVNPEIVHFSGHGYREGALCFEDRLGKIHPVRPEALSTLFEQFAGRVKCVVLNACYSKGQAKAISKHIEYVIGMSQAISDKAAIAFAVGFYQALGAERSVEESYRLGCAQIGLQGLPDHLVPVLTQGEAVETEWTAQATGRTPGLYQAEISRSNPALFVFLIDQSGSMAEPLASHPQSRAAAIADVVNRMLSGLAIRSSRGEQVRDYFHIAALGYGSEAGRVAPILSGTLSGRDVVGISELAAAPLRFESRTIHQPDGRGNMTPVEVELPIWIEPVAGADAPMCECLRKAHRIVAEWIDAGHEYAFPPIVINLSGGAATDGEPVRPAKNLAKLATKDGGVLLFNCCLSYMRGRPILYPEKADNIPDEYGRMMFEMSSRLTPRMRDFARGMGYSIGNQARGFTYQADLVDVVRFIDIGTRPADLR